MTLAQLIAQFRIEAFDQTTPPLFPDAELELWFNEAETEAAIRKQLLRETSDPLLTQFDVRTRVMTYPLDSRMFEIDYASLVFKGSDGMLPYVLAITTPQELDGMRPFWRTLPYRPTGIIQYDTKLGTDALPDTSYTIRVEGYRLPMYSMGLVAVAETLAEGTITLTGGTDGYVTAVLIDGVDILGSSIAFDTSLEQTAVKVVTQINTNQNKWTASSVGEVITLTDITGSGSMHNGLAVSASLVGTLTATFTPISGGIDRIVTSPEIGRVHHRHLVKWALHRAYQKPDVEVFDLNKSKRALGEFEDYFGERPDALNRKRQNASRPHRNAAYP